MKISSTHIFILLITVAIVSFSVGEFFLNNFKGKSFEEKRNEILSEIDFTLKEAKQSGKYECCIEPACKMCFLGNWIWDDGTCDCDTMIMEGKWDKVCPECKSGIEEGRCTSEEINVVCPVNIGGEA